MKGVENMYFNILKKDLKRKKTMNIVLLLFIILATMFVSSGLNNVLTVLNGTDYFFDKAGVGDYVIITMGENSVGNISNALDNAECIDDYRVETAVFINQNNVTRTDGTEINSTSNVALFQAVDNAKLNIFDKNNEKITEVNEGEVIICGKYMEKNNVETGEYIRIKASDVEIDLKIAGKGKDAFLGSEFMGNYRFLLNKNDYEKLLADETLSKKSMGEIAYIETDDISALHTYTTKIENIMFEGRRSQLSTVYLIEMIAAFIVLILSVCLVIVAFVVLKFSISFTIAEEYREIGVMKAIGLKNGKIRTLYIVKYLIMAVIGGIIGFFASVPFGNMLIMSASNNMVLGNDAGILINIFSSIFTIAVIVMFAYSCTKKIKKLTPIDAIRNGQTGERFKKKSFISLNRTKANPTVYMAVNDILSAPKRFMTVIISFFVCTLFVLVLVNTVSTMKSSALVNLFSVEEPSHIYTAASEEFIGDNTSYEKEDYKELINEMADEITAEGMPCTVGRHFIYKYKITSKGDEFAGNFFQGINISADEFAYFEGTAPQNINEIAVTPQVSEKINAKIGDTVTVDFGTEKIDCIVTGYFQTMQMMGEMMILSDEAPVSSHYLVGYSMNEIRFTDNPDEKEIEKRKEKISELYNLKDNEVQNAAEFCAGCVGVVPTMEAVQYLLLGITILIVILVTVLVERSFISDEKGQIAMLKALGFKTGDIVKWHSLRFGIAAVIAAILAAVLSIPATDLCITPVFGMMGAINIDYNYEPLKIFLFYPLVIFAVTFVTAWLTSLYTKTIKTSEVSGIE